MRLRTSTTSDAAGSQDDTRWQLVYKPRKSPRYAAIAAAAVIVAFTVIAALLRLSDTGAYFQTSDQVAMALIGWVIGGSLLTITRARIRVGAEGVAVRNLLTERIFDWSVVRGVWYPDSANWARLELPDDEHISVLAIQANDGEQAIAAMNDFRALRDRYTHDPER
jgi:hypothetical protein